MTRDYLPMRKLHQRCKSRVDPYTLSDAHRSRIHRDVEDDVPLAILTRQDGRRRRRREFPVPFDLHLTGDSDKANPTALPERQTIAHPELGGEIGRASCRERVCQYV